MASITDESRLAASPSEKAPLLLRYRSSSRFILFSICVGAFTDGFLYGVIVPILPFMLEERLRIADDEVQYWSSMLFTIYGASILLGSPLFGWLADHSSSRRIPFIVGLAMLVVGTVMLCAGTNIYVVAASRVLQGLSCSVVFIVGPALLVDTVDRKEIGQCMGYFMSSVGMALLVAPLLGGLVHARAGYYPVFAMIFGLILVDIVLRLSLIEKRHAAKWSGFPKANTYGTFANGQRPAPPSSADVASHDHVSGLPTDSAAPNGPSISNADTRPTTLESSTEAAAKEQARPPTFITLLRTPRLMVAIYGIFIYMALLSCFDGILPLYVTRTFDWTSLGVGLIFLCLCIPSLVGPLVGMLYDRYGPRWLAVGGLICTTPSLILLREVHRNTTEQVVLLCVLLVSIGLTLGFVITPLAAELTFAVETIEKENPGIFGQAGAYGQGFALYTIALATAIMLGPFVSGLLQVHVGWSTTTMVLGVFTVSGVIPVLIFSGGLITKRQIQLAEEDMPVGTA